MPVYICPLRVMRASTTVALAVREIGHPMDSAPLYHVRVLNPPFPPIGLYSNITLANRHLGAAVWLRGIIVAIVAIRRTYIIFRVRRHRCSTPGPDVNVYAGYSPEHSLWDVRLYRTLVASVKRLPPGPAQDDPIADERLSLFTLPGSSLGRATVSSLQLNQDPIPITDSSAFPGLRIRENDSETLSLERIVMPDGVHISLTEEGIDPSAVTPAAHVNVLRIDEAAPRHVGSATGAHACLMCVLGL